MSAVAIGATVVAVGTSAPELSVSLDAAFNDHTDVSVGNIVGSNVCNIILVLGLCGLAGRLRASRQVYRLDFPILVIVSGIFTWMILDQSISRLEGIVLLAGFVAYVLWNMQRAAEDKEVEKFLVDELAETIGEHQEHWVGPVLRAATGIVCLGLGAKWLVDGSLQALEPFQLSEAAIGVSVVALGTSVPELGTSIIAARIAVLRAAAPAKHAHASDRLTGLPDRAAMQDRVIRLLETREPFTLALLPVRNRRLLGADHLLESRPLALELRNLGQPFTLGAFTHAEDRIEGESKS